MPPVERRIALAFLLLFALNAILVWPLWLPGELPYRGSIEGGYAGMARFLSDNPNPWGWNPYVYCGEPARHTYPPALLAVAAAGMKILPFLDPPHVWRLLTVALTCLHAPLLFLLLWFATRRFALALFTAVVFTFLSPAYQFFPAANLDRGIAHLPWRFHVLAKYGEGPHNGGLALLPLALLALRHAAQSAGARWMVLAAAALAVTASSNWIAAMALAWCGAMFLLTRIAQPREILRACGAAALAYGFIAFWYSPTYILSVFKAWPQDAFNYQLGEAQLKAQIGLLAGTLLLRAFFGWRARNEWACWLTLCAFGFGWLAFGHYRFQIDTIPEARRYAVEFLFFLFAAVPVLLSRIPVWILYQLLVLLASPMLPDLVQYAKRPISNLRPLPATQTVEHKAAAALHGLQPKGRVVVSGGLRFRLLQWYNLPQVAGTFESGLPNRQPWDFYWHIRKGTDSVPDEHGADALREMTVMGVEYVVIHTAQSSEFYRDFVRPAMFEGLLEKAIDLGEDEIFRVPFRSYAHLVYKSEQPVGRSFSWLAHYSDAARDPRRPTLTTEWETPSRLTIQGPVARLQQVSVKVNYDDGWRATQDGQPLEVGRDRLGFILLDPVPRKSTRIVLEFGPTREAYLCAALSAASVLLALYLWRRA